MKIEKTERERIIRLVKQQVVPAMGCTEPICVSLCVARAAEVLGERPVAVSVFLSANILKNAMGVGIPGTGMVGLPIAIALGVVAGKSAYGLEVLKDVMPTDVEQGKQYIAERRVKISLKEGISEKLYVEAIVESESGHRATAVIAGQHTHFVYVEKDGKVLLDNRMPQGEEAGEDECELNLRKVYDFSVEAPLEEIEFIREARRLNESASRQALKGCYGHELGKTLSRPLGRGIMGDTIFSHILSSTSCACDARMAGAMIPVMSNSGSGNQGITASVPIVVFAKELQVSEETMYRALVISNLATIHIKEGIGRLSAYCGAVGAGCGCGAGIAYLYGDGKKEGEHAIVNGLAIVSGMICDGAKASCAAKIASSVDAGILGYFMYKNGQQFIGGDGIVKKGVENTIRCVGKLASEGMLETDREIVHLMIHG